MASKRPVSPSLTIKNPSKSAICHEIRSKISGHEKTSETIIFRGFLHVRWSRLTLAELGSSSCLLEAVLVHLVAGNPCIYLAFGILHPQFPHSLTTDEILFLPFILKTLSFHRCRCSASVRRSRPRKAPQAYYTWP